MGMLLNPYILSVQGSGGVDPVTAVDPATATGGLVRWSPSLSTLAPASTNGTLITSLSNLYTSTVTSVTASGTARPTLNSVDADFNNKPSLTFNGTTNRLGANVGFTATETASTQYVVIKLDSTTLPASDGASKYIFGLNSGSYGLYITRSGASNPVYFLNVAIAGFTNGTTALVSNLSAQAICDKPIVISFRRSVASNFIAVDIDGVEVCRVTHSSGTVTNPQYQFMNTAGGSIMGGKVADHIVCNAAHSDAEYYGIIRWLREYYALWTYDSSIAALDSSKGYGPLKAWARANKVANTTALTQGIMAHMGGDSTCVGWGQSAQLPTNMLGTYSNAYIYNRSGTANVKGFDAFHVTNTNQGNPASTDPTNTSIGIGYECELINVLKRKYPGKNIYLVKKGENGNTLADYWTYNAGGNYGLWKQHRLDALTVLGYQGIQVTEVGMLLPLGTNDAADATKAGNYGTNFNNLTSDIRTQTGNANLKIATFYITPGGSYPNDGLINTATATWDAASANNFVVGARANGSKDGTHDGPFSNMARGADAGAFLAGYTFNTLSNQAVNFGSVANAGVGTATITVSGLTPSHFIDVVPTSGTLPTGVAFTSFSYLSATQIQVQVTNGSGSTINPLTVNFDVRYI